MVQGLRREHPWTHRHVSNGLQGLRSGRRQQVPPSEKLMRRSIGERTPRTQPNWKATPPSHTPTGTVSARRCCWTPSRRHVEVYILEETLGVQPCPRSEKSLGRYSTSTEPSRRTWNGICGGSRGVRTGSLERQMNSESFVELEHERSWHRAEPVSDTLNRHRLHLFGMRLGVSIQSAGFGRQQDLKRVHPSDVGGHWHHGDHSTAESGGGGIGPVIGDDDCWSATCGPSS